jgi:cyclophilin family peptidyl-prolyl cis-trans isomerase
MFTEIDPALTFDKPGMVAMVNSGPDTSGSQFFITYAPVTQYNGQYTIFGQVLSGMEVLKQLTPRDAQPGIATPPGDRLISITIEDKWQRQTGASLTNSIQISPNKVMIR